MGRNKRTGAEKAVLGNGIRRMRLERGWTQQELAKRVGLQQKQISSYERGANTPSLETWIALAQTLGVSLDCLAQLSPQDSARAPITDLDLFEKLQEIDRLSDDDRNLVRDVMDLVVFRSSARTAAASSGVVPTNDDAVEFVAVRALEENDPIQRIGRHMGWNKKQLKAEVQIAERDVGEIVKLDPARRCGKIRGASSRYQGPLFGALLLEEARGRIPAEPAEALALAEAALVSSENTRCYPTDPAVQAAALAVAGNARRALGRLREAEADLHQAWRLLHAPGLRDAALPAEVHCYLGSLRKDQGRLEEAARHLRRAGTLYDLLGEPEKASKALLTLSLVHYLGHAFDAALGAAREALEVLPADAAAWLRAYAHYNVAHHFHARGDVDAAEAELAAHRELLAAAGDEVVQHVVWLRARIAWSREDLRAAERLYTEARKRAKDRGIAWDTGLVGLELALVHLVQGRTGRVKTLALEALGVFAEQDVEREVRAALDLLEAAARRDALTRQLIEKAVAALERARHVRPSAPPGEHP